MSSSKTDYIRIIGILELNLDSENTDVTYNIEYSSDEDFDKSKPGIFTLRLSEVMDTEGFQSNDIELIASQLTEQTLVRERDEERTLNIFHMEGLPLDKWLIGNSPILKQ